VTDRSPAVLLAPPRPESPSARPERSDAESKGADGVDALRSAFDAAFARPPPEARRDEVALLAIRAGGALVALRVLETAGLVPVRKIVPVPSRRRALLGVAGLRGAVIPVFGVARLLGDAAADEAPRWMVLAAQGAERIALAFSELERHLVVPAAALHRAAGRELGPVAVSEILELDGATRPVLSIASLLEAIGGGR
jgi:chemotaxis signal transduction protein